MDKELRKLKDIKGKIEKGFINFKKSPKERITHNYIDTRLELLENQLKNFTAKYEKIVGAGEEFFDYFEEDVNEKTATIFLLLVCLSLIMATTAFKFVQKPPQDRGFRGRSISSN
ncbi:unnamed protein product [Leptidea sinapis]|uniref:Uncharacterized protein n=1 Tax=Leptidea sinapis TaxID=189913 RepID=A0A5E4QYC5_9NEOP|nr:unnamed protein product [Leptidea sinapis]